MAQVKQMCDEAGSGQHLDASGGHSESFQQAYAQAVVELRKVTPPPPPPPPASLHLLACRLAQFGGWISWCEGLAFCIPEQA